MLEKLKLLNKTILDNLNENSDIKISKTFTEVGIKILGADFGFVWFNKSLKDGEWVLAYKTQSSPYHPEKPRIDGRHYKAITTKKIFYQKNLNNLHDSNFLRKYMKSFVIIPISYRENAYGTVVLCFKNEETFSNEKKVLCEFIGNGIAQVITSSHSRERAGMLKEAKILLAQEKLKTEFIANATHELRTPLAIMKGNIDLALINKNKETRQKEAIKALQAVSSEINILSEILQDLALLTSSHNEDSPLAKEKVDIIEILNSVVKRTKTLAKDKKIKIVLDIKKAPLGIVVGDKNYLEKLFLNLISNAVIYGKMAGKVLVEVSGNKKEIKISVIDNGIGISKTDLPQIFERFFRGDKAHSSGGNHSGLGLAIAKWVTETHTGTISATSKEGHGSTFTVTLPTFSQV